MRCTAPVTAHRPSPFTTLVVVGSAAGSALRGLPVWPITDLLDCDDQYDAALAVQTPDEVRTGADLDPSVLDDIIASRLIAPPRPRHRRERAVSSRAIFYQAGI